MLRLEVPSEIGKRLSAIRDITVVPRVWPVFACLLVTIEVLFDVQCAFIE